MMALSDSQPHPPNNAQHDEPKKTTAKATPTPAVIFPWWTRMTERYVHEAIPQAIAAVALLPTRFPERSILACVLLSVTLITTGFLTNFTVSVDEFTIFTPFGVRPLDHQRWIREASGFPKDPRMFGIVVHDRGNNVLGVDGMTRLFQATEALRAVPGFQELCQNAKYINPGTGNVTCRVRSSTRFWNYTFEAFRETVSSDEDVIRMLSQPTYPDGVPVDKENIFGTPVVDADTGLLISAKSYVSVFLFPDVPNVRDFEARAIDAMFPIQEQWRTDPANRFQMEFMSQRSYADEFQRAIVEDLPLVPLVFIVMILFTCGVFFKRHRVHSRVLLGVAAVGTILCSLMTAYGLMFTLGIPFTNMTQMVPFVLFGVGLDDTFIIVAAFKETDPRKSIEQRIQDCMKEIGLAITLTTTTTTFAFGLGSISNIPAVRWLCLYSMSAILIDFFYQVILFTSFLVLDERRIQANRRDVCCWIVAPAEGGVNDTTITAATTTPGQMINHQKDEEGVMGESQVRTSNRQYDPKTCTTTSSFSPLATTLSREEPRAFVDYFMEWYSEQLLQPAVKMVVLVLFTALFMSCVFSTMELTQEFYISDFIPEDSYVADFIHYYEGFSSRTYPLFAYFRFVDQSDKQIQEQMINFVDELADLELISPNPPFCWIHDFTKLLEDNANNTLLAGREFYDVVNYLFQDPQVQDLYGENIVFDENGIITASRCIMFAADFSFDSIGSKTDLLHDQNRVSAKQPINQGRADWAFFTFADQYLSWEFFDAVVKAWTFTAISGTLAVTVVALVSIPHWSACCHVFIMLSVLYIDLMGIIQFAGLHINVITHITMSMSIGLLVDYIMHVLIRYYEVPATSRDEKVKQTLRTIGVPVLIGSLSTFLGALPLAFGGSEVMKTVFVSFFAMVTLGCAHGLILLPVVLSIIGPVEVNRSRTETLSEQTTYSSQQTDPRLLEASCKMGTNRADSKLNCGSDASSDCDELCIVFTSSGDNVEDSPQLKSPGRVVVAEYSTSGNEGANQACDSVKTQADATKAPSITTILTDLEETDDAPFTREHADVMSPGGLSAASDYVLNSPRSGIDDPRKLSADCSFATDYSDQILTVNSREVEIVGGRRYLNRTGLHTESNDPAQKPTVAIPDVIPSATTSDMMDSCRNCISQSFATPPGSNISWFQQPEALPSCRSDDSERLEI